MEKRLLSLMLLVISCSASGQTGVIKGKIFNSINNQPLAFVSVAIQGSIIGTVTDTNGYYELKNLKPGLYNLSASYVGFESKTIFEIEVNNVKPAIVDFPLKIKTTNLSEVEIKSSPFVRREESPISLRNIGVNEIARNPGGNRDISKVIQSLPGVAQTVTFRNDIIIRGGSPNENVFLLDDIAVPNINHFATQGSSGGPVGMINVDFIREVLFYSSAFPANRHNALSSVMDFKLLDGRSDHFGGKFTLGASDLGVTTEGPVHRNATILASVRRSYLQFLFDLIDLPFLPTYNDFMVKYKWKPDIKNELTFIGLGAIDEFELNTKLQETGDDQQKYILGYLPVQTQWNYMNGIKYVHYQKNSYTTIVLSRNMLNNESFKYFNNDDSRQSNLILDYKSQEIENRFRIEETVRRNGFKINYGLNLLYGKYYNSTFNRITTPAGIDTVNFETRFTLWKWGAFFQVSRGMLNERLTLSLGVRSDANNYAKSMANFAEQLSPRFSVSYSIAPRLIFSINTGLYYQLPPYTVLGFKDRSGILINKKNQARYMRAYHVVSGFEYITEKNLKVTVEGFIKFYSQYPFLVKDSVSLANLGSDFGVIGNDEVVSTSTGRSYGIEFMAQQKLYNDFYGLLTYTFVRSEFRNQNAEFVPSSWDNIHIINIIAGKKLKKAWEAGIKWRFSVGAPYTPYDVELSRLIANWNINGQGIPNWALLNKERLKPFHSLDVRLDKKYFFPGIDLNFYLDIQNVYNFQSELPPILDVVRDANGQPLVDPSDPSKYLVRFIDNYTGTILPTIGVVIEL